MKAAASMLQAVEEERRAGFVVRVSTDRQAQNDEGSLKTQLQRLREHLRYKREAVGEPWEEVALYELRGVSGKDSMRSKEFERLFADVRSGRVNTVVCTSLDRVCRSVVDFLHFFEFLNEHGAQFVCLKQQYDTTSPQGVCLSPS
jgi:DNA invertase Pin-like site-specific DNA recombinase